MNWLTDYVRPKIKALVRSNRPEVPENLWVHCPSCERMIFHRDLETNQRVCTHCGHHFRVGPEFRFQTLFDDGAWTRIELPKAPTDPLKFRDRRRYAERTYLASSRRRLDQLVRDGYVVAADRAAMLRAAAADYRGATAAG